MWAYTKFLEIYNLIFIHFLENLECEFGMKKLLYAHIKEKVGQSQKISK